MLLGAMCVALALAACGGSSSQQWNDLQSVSVTVSQPGLPPPFGSPRTSSFTTSSQLSTVTGLLNDHRIAKASSTTPNNGCAGGSKVGIVIVPKGASPTRLSAYQCAGKVSGDVSGDLTGFLSAIGFKT